MSLTDIRKIQADTLSLFQQEKGGDPAQLPGISCPQAAARLGILAGAVRQRLIRYEREGWLERTPLEGAQGFEYYITARGLARLDWLRAQEGGGKSSSVLPWLLGGAALVGVVAILLQHRKTPPPPDEGKEETHA